MKSICAKMPQKSYYETKFFFEKKKKEFVGEVWWPIKETGRLVPYPGDSWIIRESGIIQFPVVTY